MKNPLALGRENAQKAPATALSDAPQIILRDLPGIAEIERLCHGQGEWLTDAEIAERAEKVSLSLFGISENDTYGPMSFIGLTPEQHDRREKRPTNWELNFDIPDRNIESDALYWCFWDDLGVDVDAEDGELLRCSYLFGRQLICVIRTLIPEAVLTPDGSGGAAMSEERLTAKLEDEVRRFKRK